MNKFLNSAISITQKGDDFISQHGPVEFHKKAHELLDHARLHEDFNFSELVESSFFDNFNKVQSYTSAQFSDFPLTVACGAHCFVDVYFWRRRPTVIHNHHFTGAFQCLEGVNIDLEFEFKKSRGLGIYTDLGEVILKQSRKIVKGDIAPIDLLDKFIHQNHHQAELTINLCFRTPDIGETNLSNYLYSGLRFEKHPEVLERTHRLWHFLFLGDFNFKKINLSIDDALNFLIHYQHSTSLSKNFAELKLHLDQRVKQELGIDVADLFDQHQKKIDDLENLYE